MKSPNLNQDYLVRVKDYAGFFRILYNATYVSRTASEWILGALSESTFQKGIVAGVPRGTAIAHKFGERTIDDTTEQLHDCGIVYGKNPYIICVMSRGKAYEKLEDFISAISKTTYNHLGK
jgi:beta-lactamase class A